MSDIDIAVVDSLKVLDPKRPIREADIEQRSNARDEKENVGPEYRSRSRLKTPATVKGRSPFRHSGHAQALMHALASCKVGRIVARRHVGAEPTQGKTRIDCKSRSYGGSRLIQMPEPRQVSTEKEMRDRRAMVGLVPRSPCGGPTLQYRSRLFAGLSLCRC